MARDTLALFPDPPLTIEEAYDLVQKHAPLGFRVGRTSNGRGWVATRWGQPCRYIRKAMLERILRAREMVEKDIAAAVYVRQMQRRIERAYDGLPVPAQEGRTRPKVLRGASRRSPP